MNPSKEPCIEENNLKWKIYWLSIIPTYWMISGSFSTGCSVNCSRSCPGTAGGCGGISSDSNSYSKDLDMAVAPSG